jgi:hypothetical protein
MEEEDLPEGEPSAKRHGVAQQGMHYHDRSTEAVVPKILDHPNSIRFSSVTPFQLPLFWKRQINMLQLNIKEHNKYTMQDW